MKKKHKRFIANLAAMVAKLEELSNSEKPTKSDDYWNAENPFQPDIFPPLRQEGFLQDNGWIEWKGGQCPIDREQLVDVKFNTGRIAYAEAFRFRWWWAREDIAENIVAYRVTQQPVVAKTETVEPTDKDSLTVPDSALYGEKKLKHNFDYVGKYMGEHNSGVKKSLTTAERAELEKLREYKRKVRELLAGR